MTKAPHAARKAQRWSENDMSNLFDPGQNDPVEDSTRQPWWFDDVYMTIP
jgi:hypothetical protein